MADLYLDDFAKDVHKIQLLQSCWRGYVTRKKLKESHEEFKNIQVELSDTDSSFLVSKKKLWPLSLGRMNCSKVSQDIESHCDNQDSDQALQSNKKTLDVKCHCHDDTKKDNIIKRGMSDHQIHSRSSSDSDDSNTSGKSTDEERTINKEIETKGQTQAVSYIDSQTKHIQVKDEDENEQQTVESDTPSENLREKPIFNKETTQEDLLFQSEKNKQELESERSSTAMELLWVQQAIESRKQYLRLRTDISE